nr:uncharacterized protein LOC121122961 [Lepeophtheirus salmonis]
MHRYKSHCLKSLQRGNMLTQLFILFANLFAIVLGQCSPNQIQNCLMAANYKLGKSVPGLPGPISDAICVNIQEQVNCIQNSNVDCAIPNKKVAQYFNDIKEKLETQKDNTTYKSCKNEKNFPEKFMLGMTGSNKCNFLDYHIRFFPQQHDCITTHISSWKNKIKSIKNSKLSNHFLTKLACDGHNSILRTCRDGLVKKCFSFKKGEELKKNEDKIFYGIYESIIRQELKPNFKLERQCV